MSAIILIIYKNARIEFNRLILCDTEDQIMIKFNEKMISYHDKFRLFITTKLANPHYAPEISTKTTLCNFAIKEEGN